MRNIKLFYLRYCPYCRSAFKIIDKLKDENVAYKNIDIDYIDENKNKALSDSYDYDLVPCFFINNEKIHEGITNSEDIEKIFKKALNS